MQNLDGSDFVILGVNADRELAIARRSAKKHQLDWRHFFDGKRGPISQLWNITAWPSTVLIDRHGKIREKNFSYKPYDEILTLVREIAAEPYERQPTTTSP